MRAREFLPKQKLFEMPYLIAGRLVSPLEDDAVNAAVLATIQANNPRIIEDDLHGTLYGTDGGYAYFSKQTGRIEYHMLFIVDAHPVLKTCATQISVWASAVAPSGLTQKVFFGEMMHRFDTMVSDEEHSKDGQRFWLRALSGALRHGFRIGLMEGKQIVSVYDAATLFRQWLDKVAAHGWGSDPEHRGRLFFITKIQVE